MSKETKGEDAALLNHLHMNSITDLTKQLQPGLSRLKEHAEPPCKPSQDELRSLEWDSRALLQGRSPSRRGRDPATFRSLTTTHNFLAGLSVEEIPKEWTEELSSCDFFPKDIKWAREEDASLGIGVAVGDFYGCKYTGGINHGWEINSALSAFRFKHQLLPEREKPLFPTGYRLRLTVKAEVLVPVNPLNYMIFNHVEQGYRLGVRGEISIFMKAPKLMLKTVPFLDVWSYGRFSTRWEVNPTDNPFVFVSGEVSVPSDMTDYEAFIFVNLKAFRKEGGKGFAGINLAGPDARMWWSNMSGAGPVIIHYLKTVLRRELQETAPPVIK